MALEHVFHMEPPPHVNPGDIDRPAVASLLPAPLGRGRRSLVFTPQLNGKPGPPEHADCPDRLAGEPFLHCDRERGDTDETHRARRPDGQGDIDTP
jgi:hypothetical protein